AGAARCHDARRRHRLSRGLHAEPAPAARADEGGGTGSRREPVSGFADADRRPLAAGDRGVGHRQHGVQRRAVRLIRHVTGAPTIAKDTPYPGEAISREGAGRMVGGTSRTTSNDPMPSWNDTPSKRAITAFVQRVARAGSPEFVPEPERIAVFDNDGTLWVETTIHFQAACVHDERDRRRAMEPQLAADPMVQAMLRGDVATLLAGAHHDGLLHVLALTHAGITPEEFG